MLLLSKLTSSMQRIFRMVLALLPILIFASKLDAQNPAQQQAKSPPDNEPPTLIILISVDQMRYDYLTRFRDQFEGGFARLLTKGTLFNNAHHVHAITGTGPGHATLSTGCFPSHHGITENEMFMKSSGKMEYAVSDPKTQLVGAGNSKVMGMSPIKLRIPTIGDRLKVASPNSKVYAVALKDRSSILMAGKKADKAFWFDDATGKFVSSTFYGKNYPNWANKINGYELFAKDLEKGWHRMYPKGNYTASREDEFPAEEGFFLSTFPHTKSRMQPFIKPAMKNARMMWVSPLGDRFSFEFSKKLILKEKLGMDSDPDLLFIGCSAADKIGHHYGPMSQEMQDYYLRLDQYLGEFFNFLDENIGQNRYLIVLSADHGVMRMPEELKRQGLPGKRISRISFQNAATYASSKVMQVLGLQNPVIKKATGSGVNLNYEEAKAKGISAAKLRAEVAKSLKAIPYVSDTYTQEELMDKSVKRKHIVAYRRSFDPQRSFEIMIRFKKYVLADATRTGVSHGTPYDYDSHIPIIFYGNAIPQAGIPRKVRTVDIAPTLAAWLQLPVPMDMDGQLLPEVVKW